MLSTSLSGTTYKSLMVTYRWRYQILSPFMHSRQVNLPSGGAVRLRQSR